MSLFDLFKQSNKIGVPSFSIKTRASSLCLFKWMKHEARPKSDNFWRLTYRFFDWSSYSMNAFWSLKNWSLSSSPKINEIILAQDSYEASAWPSIERMALRGVMIPPFSFLTLSTTSLRTLRSSMRMASTVGSTNSINSRSELRHLMTSKRASMMASESLLISSRWTVLFSWAMRRKFSIDLGLSSF